MVRANGAKADDDATLALTELTGYLLRRAFVLSTDCARECIDDGANLRDTGILALLEEQGPMSQREAAGLLGVNPTIMVKLVDALEAGGYLVRGRDPSDRRRYALTLTSSGKDRLADLLRDLDRSEDVLTREISTEDKHRLNHWLRKVVPDRGGRALASLADHTGYLIWLAHQASASAATERLRPLGLEPRDFGALSAVARGQPCSQQHVARELGVTPPAVMWLIEDLEGSGLLRRARSTDDRRAYDLTLTEMGERCLVDANRAVAGWQSELAGRVGVRGDREMRLLLRAITGV